MRVHTRQLTDTDLASMRELLFADGPNEWNYLTEESVDLQMDLIRQGKARAVIAENGRILGFAVLIFGYGCPDKLKKYADLSKIAYINDVVVSRELAGKGYGTKLLAASLALAKSESYDSVYIERHEENLASAGMMRKAGFELSETYHDPKKRSTGTQNTSIMVKHL
jgi:GNAT superfamily N-acetyltransferase